MSVTRKTLAVDFDGVIHSYMSPWTKPEAIPDPIVPGAIEFLLGALRRCEVVIFSSRAKTAGGRRAMRRWLKDQVGACWYESPAGPGIEDVQITAEKPPAVAYLDDRAVRFDGVFPSVGELLNLKPWNRE